ncbi:MAG: type II toxin-antitoxin system RatA family toxin [Haloarculaceae archaeon]
MDRIEVSTVVYLPPEEIYEFLLDFPGYARFSKYLKEVRQRGDGSPGTQYDLQFAWWKLNYTAVSEVTAVERPERIDWKLVKDIDARGHWRLEPEPESAPDGEDHATRVRLVVEYHPDSASPDAVDLPTLVSLGWVIEKVKPLVREEAERIVERIVADIEGQRREVELEIHTGPDAV